MTTKHCACCGMHFMPRPQVPNQTYCSAPECQRARKRQWQRVKLLSDSDYRINQRASQQAWSQRNQEYWRNYRANRPEYELRNRERQRLRDANRADVGLAKMDVCDLPTGLYRITHQSKFRRENADSWVVEITAICMTCPCKMAVSREDLIDTPAIRP
jgi:hypothetical protein